MVMFLIIWSMSSQGKLHSTLSYSNTAEPACQRAQSLSDKVALLRLARPYLNNINNVTNTVMVEPELGGIIL